MPKRTLREARQAGSRQCRPTWLLEGEVLKASIGLPLQGSKGSFATPCDSAEAWLKSPFAKSFRSSPQTVSSLRTCNPSRLWSSLCLRSSDQESHEEPSCSCGDQDPHRPDLGIEGSSFGIGGFEQTEHSFHRTSQSDDPPKHFRPERALPMSRTTQGES